MAFVIFKFFKIGDVPEQCPVDFPKVFNHGKSCCKYDKDKEDNLISSFSQTCKLHIYRPCQKDHCIDNGNRYDYIIVIFQKCIIPFCINQICISHIPFFIQIADGQRCAVLGEKYDPTTTLCRCGSKYSCVSGMW